MGISANFDSGNIEFVAKHGETKFDLKIRKDFNSDFYQWFHFRLVGEIGEQYTFTILNAAESAYPAGWESYQAVASYDRENWFRVPTEYENGQLTFEHELTQQSVFFAYFAPYSRERHFDLIQQVSASHLVSLHVGARSLQGRDLEVIECGATDAKKTIWIIGRQHPGETMAEWFIEGLLSRLLDDEDPVAVTLRRDARFFIVPNMNPDGSELGHLRTNAKGVNLNREWATPSLESSPEVYGIKAMMEEQGCDLFLDIHGDEAIPYNFIAASEGVPSYDDKMADLEEHFRRALLAASPDFQVEHGYPKDEPGKADLRIASNAVAEQFKCLALTVEMPFKDNDNLPNPAVGWSPNRCITFGRDMLNAVAATLNKL